MKENRRKSIEVDFNHTKKVLSLAHLDVINMIQCVFHFSIYNGEISLMSIDHYVKNGKSGNTYKHTENYHYQYKTKITNFETGDFEEPIVPDYLWEIARLYFVGYVAQHSI